MSNELISVFIASFCAPLVVYYFRCVYVVLTEQSKETAARQAEAEQIRSRLW